MSIFDSTLLLEKDAHDINLLLQHKEDDGTAMDLRTRVQDHLECAECKLRFVGTLRSSYALSVVFLNKILGEDDDDAQFMVRVR